MKDTRWLVVRAGTIPSQVPAWGIYCASPERAEHVRNDMVKLRGYRAGDLVIYRMAYELQKEEAEPEVPSDPARASEVHPMHHTPQGEG